MTTQTLFFFFWSEKKCLNDFGIKIFQGKCSTVEN